MWFVNKNNKKPQKLFKKPKKRSKKYDYFIDFDGRGAYNENKLLGKRRKQKMKYYSETIPKSERITRLVEHLYAKMPEIEASRAVLITESYQQLSLIHI